MNMREVALASPDASCYSHGHPSHFRSKRPMCGIAGILSPGHQDRIRPVTRRMTYRGPDDEGYYSDAHVSLGQRRLAIIDLEGGRQPLANEDGTLQLVSNGEIYNSPELRRELEAKGHRFGTRTDVECLLHLYEEEGPACVKIGRASCREG